MNYEIEFKKKAHKFLLKQNPKQRELIMREIVKLPHARDIKKLKGSFEALRLRVGNYRVLYWTDHETKTVYIDTIDTRGDVYK